MNEDFIKFVEEGLKEIEEGQSIPLEDVKRIMATWHKQVSFDAISLKTSSFKFDRDEANER